MLFNEQLKIFCFQRSVLVDLKRILNARSQLKMGLKVPYDTIAIKVLQSHYQFVLVHNTIIVILVGLYETLRYWPV